MLKQADTRSIQDVVTRIPFQRARPLLSLTLCLLLLCLGATAAPAGAATNPSNWNRSRQRQVVAAGLMEGARESFNGAGLLSAAQANRSMAALAARLQSEAPQAGETAYSGEACPSAPRVVHTSRNPVSVRTFDRMLIEQLGLGDVASKVQSSTVAAALHPPSYFGSETVARLLELRFEQPVGSQRMDLFPVDPITSAEAATSLGRVLELGRWGVSSARESLSAFELPAMSAAQRQALQIAVSRIGYPYIWGGTTDDTSDGLEHGGFDCSGFAWRVFKVSGLPSGQQIQGRTAAEQAREIPRSQRLRITQLKPGDLLFFGSAHFTSRATEANVIHEGIYLGDNWVIHSSGQGVYVVPLKGSWLGNSFAWGRRVIG